MLRGKKNKTTQHKKPKRDYFVNIIDEMLTNSTMCDESARKSTALGRISIFKKDCKHLLVDVL